MIHTRLRALRIFTVLSAMLLSLPVSARPTVVELYTSQGCSSCPPAEALLKQLTKDPTVLALAFHVHYWDRNGFADPYSSKDNTQRQNDYEAALKTGTLFTPQMIIDGKYSVVGSEADSVSDAILDARKDARETPVSIMPDGTGEGLKIVIGDGTAKSLPPHSEVTEIHFNRGGSDNVSGGENDGVTVDSSNYVTEIIPLELAASYALPLSRLKDDGVAVIIQGENQGPVLGAAFYMKN